MSAATTMSPTSTFPAIVWRHPLLADLDARARTELESAGEMRTLREGEKLFAAGDPSDALVVVTKGEIVLRANGRSAELRRASAGDALGEEAAGRAHATRRHDATSANASEVALLPAALLRRVIARGDESSDAAKRRKRWLVRALASDALERADFARDVPKRARDVMLDAGRAIELHRGDVVHREGDASSEAYFVAEGIIQLTTGEGERRVLAYHRTGDFFGDEAIEGEARDATATATSEAWIFAVRADVVRAMAIKHPAALAHALRVQTSARAKQRQIRENATRHVLADLHRFETSRSLLAIDQERCIRCGHCAWSCATAHDDGVSRLLRRGDVVVAKVHGERLTLLLPSSCQHCKNPACMIDCPTGAITRDARGEVHIREELCTGCGSCVKACPWDNIQLARPEKRRLPLVKTDSNAVAVKCDLCHDRGGEPACVASCPADAIMRIDPSVNLDDVRAVLDPRAPAQTNAPKRGVLVPAIVAASASIALAAFVGFDEASRRASGIALLALVVVLASYAIVKRARTRLRVRPHFVVHVAVGLLTLGVAATHAHGYSALAIAFWGATALGALAGALGVLVPKRLARIERDALLPEEIGPKLAEVDARVFRDLSGTSDLLKGIYARILRPYSRSTFVLATTCLLGTPQRAVRERLTARVRALVGGEDERLVGLDGLVAIVAQRQALRAERILTAALRATSFAHVVVACGLGVLVVLHVVEQALR